MKCSECGLGRCHYSMSKARCAVPKEESNEKADNRRKDKHVVHEGMDDGKQGKTKRQSIHL